MKIIRASDIVQIKINTLEIKVKPLTYGKRIEMAKFVTVKDGKEVQNYADTMMFLIKNTVKGIKSDGEELALEFENDVLSDDSMTDVMGLLEGNVEAFKDITIISSAAGKKIPKIINPEDGKEIEGVEITVLPKK